MGAFEYSYSFSSDDEILRRYSDCSKWYGNSVIETRIKFIVKGNSSISGETMIIDSESYATGVDDDLELLQFRVGMRLKDCWMPDWQIGTMATQLLLFVQQIRRTTGRPGKIPALVDVEVCTVQREGEAMAAAVERAMRPELLPPLYLYPMCGFRNPTRLNTGEFDMSDLISMPVIPVDEASSIMDLCRICGRKPIFGTQIAVLCCGHVFHYHCAARILLEESNSCPVCLHEPGFNPSLFSSWSDSENDDDDETYWGQLLDDDDDDDDNDYPAAPAPHDSDSDSDSDSD